MKKMKKKIHPTEVRTMITYISYYLTNQWPMFFHIFFSIEVILGKDGRG